MCAGKDAIFKALAAIILEGNDSMNIDRKKLIDKLKSVKDPKQRDKIIWALSGLEKDIPPNDADWNRPPRTIVSKPTRKERTAPMPAQEQKTISKPPSEQKQEFPGLPAGVSARQLFSYVVPGIFLFMGLVQIMQALADILPTGRVEAGSPKLIMGGMFVVFGIISIIKANKKAKEPADQDKESKKQA